MEEEKKIILTTEKDAVRLELHRDFLLETRLPIFVGIDKVKFLELVEYRPQFEKRT